MHRPHRCTVRVCCRSLPLSRIHNMLRMFVPASGGDRGYDRSEAELQRHLHPSGGYTKHSKIYQLLIDELQRMGNEARAVFENLP